MTAELSISLSDEQEAYARTLVEAGQYPNVSAVLQRGLEMLRSGGQRATLDDLLARYDPQQHRHDLVLDQALAEGAQVRPGSPEVGRGQTAGQQPRS